MDARNLYNNYLMRLRPADRARFYQAFEAKLSQLAAEVSNLIVSDLNSYSSGNQQQDATLRKYDAASRFYFELRSVAQQQARHGFGQPPTLEPWEASDALDTSLGKLGDVVEKLAQHLQAAAVVRACQDDQ